ncbi:di-heme oxidoredictase family protein [Haloferula sp.]|uniref:di-heme oxidoredictase family protein n=1 Tax=Haloferula sp. TaxID=2497595 RepID=UPI00329AF036
MNLRRTTAAFILLAVSPQGAIAATPQLHIDVGNQLNWTSSNGNTYQLQGAPDAAGPWSDLGDSTIGDGSIQTYFDPAGSIGSHYQLVETTPGTDPPPLLPLNGGFETGTESEPENWTTSASQEPIRTDTESHSGGFCVQSALANIGTAPSEGILTQTIGDEGESIVEGESYDFSFWAKQVSSGPSYIQQYELQWLNEMNAVVGGTGLKNFSATFGTWSEVEDLGLIAPAGAVGAKVTFRFVTGAVLDGHGEVLIDDVSIASEVDTGSPPETTYLPLLAQPTARISWPTVAGVPYQPRSTTDLVNWTNIDPVIQGDGGIGEFLAPMDMTTEAFRVEFPSSPDGPDPETGIVALFDASTVLEAPTTVDTPTALITYVADRARDRHAREAIFDSYDHYLSWYWEQRVANIEIIDRVAKGGTDITFNYSTHGLLSTAEFRTFFAGVTTPAQYNSNQAATLVSTTDSATPGETDYNYSATVDENANEGNRPLQIGDRIEVEISQFLQAPRNGRKNYYGTTMLYIVGQGIVPWAQGNDLGFPGGVVDNVNLDLDSHPLPMQAWLGGQTTLPYQYSNEPEHRFKQTAGNISPTNGGPFMLGRRLHHTDFGNGNHSESGNPVFATHSGKLGPDFISRSCVECHVNNGRALPPEIGDPMFQTVVKVGSDAEGTPHPTLGSVIQPQTTGASAEASATIASYVTSSGQYGDGTSYSLRQPVYAFQGVTPNYFSVRLAPQLVGLGLLEAIDEQMIIDLADPNDDDEDDISGRYQTLVDPETDETRLGRFTNKSGQARLSHQVAAALNTDMGIATTVFPILDGETSATTPEISDSELEQMTKYVALLGVGARRDLDDPLALSGEQLFVSANCTACHTPELSTGPYHPMAELRNQTIRPYTDLLLHDMGAGLADNMGEGDASGSEWRTPPLWGIGLTAGVSGGEAYLHDGRARTLEEAILWHGGEATDSKEAFRTMSSSDRNALIKFLKSL